MNSTAAPKSSERMTGAKAIVRSLKHAGITKVFCVPGESYLPVMDALYDEPQMELISARHEGGAAFMAEAWAKATGIPGVVMATRGVGAGNLAIGVHTAYQDSTPLIVLLGQVHSKFRGREGFQEVDLERFFGPIAKWTVEIKDADRVPELMQRAIRTAQSGRPGPVVVSLPEDVLPAEEEMMFGPAFSRPSPKPSNEEVMRAGKLLENAERPLIIAGGGIKSARARPALVKFAEKLHIPVMAAFRRHDCFPNSHRLYGGHLGLGTARDILQTVKEADVILAVGTRLSEVTTQDYSIISPEQQLIHIDIDEETVGKVYPPAAGIVADAKEALEALAAFEFRPVWEAWARERRSAYERAAALFPSGEENADLNRQIIGVLQELLPLDAIITNDAGNFAGWLHSFYQFEGDNSYIGPTSGAMGYGLPAAIGAKLGCPDKTVVSLSGDGGFMMTVQELETAVRCRIPVISIVYNNNMYGTIRMHQEIVFPERVIGTGLGKVQFSKLAQSIGAAGYYVRTKEEFRAAFKEALLAEAPVVIEVENDPEQISVSSTIQAIRQKQK